MALDLIYDRTLADVQRVKSLRQQILTQGFASLSQSDQTAYMAGLKGAYNAVDLNRVGSAVQTIADALISDAAQIRAYREAQGVAYAAIFDVPYDPADIVVSPKTNWTMADVPTEAQMTQYLADLAVLRDAIDLPPTAPTLPATMSNLGWQGANAIEYLLALVEQTLGQVITELTRLIDLAKAAFWYSNEIYAGEV